MANIIGSNKGLIETYLDGVFFDKFDRANEVKEVMATDEIFFKQESINVLTYSWEEHKAADKFRAHNERELIDEVTPRTGNTKSVDVNFYKSAMPISREYYRAAKFGAIEYDLQDMAAEAKNSRDDYAFAQSYGDAFSGVTTPDGVALCSNSHISLNGDTIDNLETGALSSANLDTLYRALRLQKKQNGNLGAQNAVGLMVPVALLKTATEITESRLVSGKTDNDINYWKWMSDLYQGLVVGTSAYLSSTYNGGLNSNVATSYFLVSNNHGITRMVYEGLTTDLISPSQQVEEEYTYKARFYEIVAAKSWTGIVGSNGTT